MLQGTYSSLNLSDLSAWSLTKILAYSGLTVDLQWTYSAYARKLHYYFMPQFLYITLLFFQDALILNSITPAGDIVAISIAGCLSLTSKPRPSKQGLTKLEWLPDSEGLKLKDFHSRWS